MTRHNPPKWARGFLRWFVSEELIEEIEGDLIEAYRVRRNKHGKLHTDFWYVKDVFRFFKPYSFEKHSRTKQFLPIFNNHLKTAIRNLLKYRTQAAINLFGLSIGVTSVMLLGTYLYHELTYDHSFPDSERIYRVVNNYRDQTYTCMKFNDYFGSNREVQLQLVKHLKEYEGVLEACHFVPNMSAIGPSEKWYVQSGKKEIVLENFLFTNTGVSFNSIFPQRFLVGDPKSAFNNFQTVVLTVSTAKLLFGPDWESQGLLDQSININDQSYLVTGVVQDVPGNIHFDFEILVNQETIPSWAGYTYFKTDEIMDGYTVAEWLNRDVETFYPGYTADILSKGIDIVPLQDVHFTDRMLYEIKPIANNQYLSMFLGVGIIILFIIWINCANLSIATYAGRQRELAVRKVFGARSKDVSFQVITESILQALLAFPVIWFSCHLFLPIINDLLVVSIDQNILLQPIFILTIIIILLGTGLISGVYPAAVFGSKSMMRLFEGKLNARRTVGPFTFRRVLLTTQFFMVIGLLSLALFINQQLDFIQSKPSGFRKDGIVFFEVDGVEKYRLLEPLIQSIPEVEAVGNGMVPGAEMYNQLTYKLEGIPEILSDGTHLYTSLASMEVFGIRSEALRLLEAGQDSVLIINQTAAKKLATMKKVEVEDIVGEKIILEPEWENEEFGYGLHYTIAAIIDDFDYFSLKYESQSLFIEVHRESDWVYNMIISAKSDNWFSILSQIEEYYMTVESSRPFDPKFLNDHLAQLYQLETNAGRLASYLTIICVILAMMGLVGIVSYVTFTRIKEIAIRKVFGATTNRILFTLNTEYAYMIVVATLFAIPSALYFSGIWLQNFAFRIIPSPVTVLLGGMATFLVVSTVVIVKSFQSANKNPSETLKYE